jgi:ABC-type lipoprotein release transport system permease subunit
LEVNKKAQASVVVFMLAITIVILALAWAKPLNEQTTLTMNETNQYGEVGGMNCTGATDNYIKAACWITDINQGYFIGALIAIAGLVIGVKILFGD